MNKDGFWYNMLFKPLIKIEYKKLPEEKQKIEKHYHIHLHGKDVVVNEREFQTVKKLFPDTKINEIEYLK